MDKFVRLVAVLGLALGVFMAMGPHRASANFAAVAVEDAYVSSANATSTHNSTSLWTDNDTDELWTYLKFDITSMVLANRYQEGFPEYDACEEDYTVAYVIVGATNYSLDDQDLYLTSNSWSESTLKWNNKPAAGTYLSAGGGYDVIGWEYFGELIFSDVCETQTYVSFIIKNQGSDALGMRSSEYGSGQLPTIEIS